MKKIVSRSAGVNGCEDKLFSSFTHSLINPITL